MGLVIGVVSRQLNRTSENEIDVIAEIAIKKDSTIHAFNDRVIGVTLFFSMECVWLLILRDFDKAVIKKLQWKVTFIYTHFRLHLDVQVCYISSNTSDPL